MAADAAYDGGPEVGHAARPDRLSLIGDAYDEHGIALFRLAHAICRDDEMAAAAVVQAFHAAFADSSRTDRDARIFHDLVRLTYLACMDAYAAPNGPADEGSEAPDATPMDACLLGLDCQRRALLALTLFGDHTYDEAAALLHIEPSAAARALRITLRESGRVPRSRNGRARPAP